MVLDIIIALIILVSCVVGYKCGLASMVSKLGSWLVATVLAFSFASPLRTYLCENTEIDENFYKKFVEKLSGDSAESTSAVPELLKDTVTSAKTHFVNATATELTDVVMAIFAFLIILVAVKLVAFAFAHIFSKKHSAGVIGFTDGVLGLSLGLIVGVIIVIALMAFAVPFAMTSVSSFGDLYIAASKGSIIAPYLYDYNLILVFIKDFLM